MENPNLKWETNKPNLPINCCYPCVRVTQINGMLHAGWEDRMFQLIKEGSVGGREASSAGDSNDLECL